jgi:xanthine dehydrogenase accessory factor
MSDWLSLLLPALEVDPFVVRVVVASTLGSSPREAGACMIVGTCTLRGSIGGGNLEFKAIEIARAMLQEDRRWQTASFPLGPALGQCCGGMVGLWFERIELGERGDWATIGKSRDTAASQDNAAWAVLATIAEKDKRLRRVLFSNAIPGHVFAKETLDFWARREAESMRCRSEATYLLHQNNCTLLLERLDPRGTPLFIFGAGHVGKAMVPILAGLPFRVVWVDSRDDIFPGELPENVTAHQAATPVEFVERAPDGACFLVLTHSHALDYDLCKAILVRDTFCFLGLIGSHTKAARFAHRLTRDGLPPERIGRLVCPFGIAGIEAKQPQAIAVAVAAQLLRLREKNWDPQLEHERARGDNHQPQPPREAGQPVPVTVHRTFREN